MRVCPHPHKSRSTGLELIEPLPLPHEALQLILVTEGGETPYCGIENERAFAAAEQLGNRHLAARTACGWVLRPGHDYADPDYARPQLVLAAALAEAEGRLCVADWCRERLRAL